MCSVGALDCWSGGTHCASRKRRVSAVRRLSAGVESERTLAEPLKTSLHLVLTQCADNDSRADRTSKPCLLLSCYRAVDLSRLVSRAPFSGKLRSGKIRGEHNLSKSGAGLVPSICWLFDELHVLLRRSRRTFGVAAVSPVICNSGAGWRGQITVPTGNENVRCCG
jgi:hypothetical protein